MKNPIRWARARTVIGTAVFAYREGRYPYQNSFLPQDILPEEVRKDPLLSALILFYSCHYMRGTIKSDYAMRCMVKLWRERPEFFDPSVMAYTPQEDIREVLKKLLPYKSEEISFSWKENSRRLMFHWHGDPRTIFHAVRSPQDMYRYVANRNSVKVKSRGDTVAEDGFLGFQKKMASMLAYYLESCGLIPTQKKEPVPPVDFHHLRILVATEAIVLDQPTARYEILRPLGEEIYEKLMPKLGVRMLELGNALWVISNRLCAKSPVTQTLDGELLAPDWKNPETVRAYKATCGACPVAQWCKRAVQANVYYQKGYFELSRLREQPELSDELPMHLPLVHPPKKRKPH